MHVCIKYATSCNNNVYISQLFAHLLYHIIVTHLCIYAVCISICVCKHLHIHTFILCLNILGGIYVYQLFYLGGKTFSYTKETDAVKNVNGTRPTSSSRRSRSPPLQSHSPYSTLMHHPASGTAEGSSRATSPTVLFDAPMQSSPATRATPINLRRLLWLQKMRKEELSCMQDLLNKQVQNKVEPAGSVIILMMKSAMTSMFLTKLAVAVRLSKPTTIVKIMKWTIYSHPSGPLSSSPSTIQPSRETMSCSTHTLAAHQSLRRQWHCTQSKSGVSHPACTGWRRGSVKRWSP